MIVVQDPVSFHGRRPASERASAAARAASRKSDTRCEARLRSLLWRSGARFRKNVADLPGTPDVVFPRRRLAIFCDGDFWHGRDWETRRRRLAAGHNGDYWIAKIERNMERDRTNTQRLEQEGWTVLRFWEKEILKSAGPIVEAVLEALSEAGAERLDNRVASSVEEA